jgi:polyhydroxyalkanoate synthase
VFITSWKNPGEEMRDVRFDDYLIEGVQALVDTARGLTGAAKVHAVGYCIGGTALSTYMAWANRHFAPEDVPVAHFTLFTTLVDFHKPGDIEVFVDEGSIRFITQNMERKGYLDGAEMASSFRLLRSNSLIWHYVVHGWLYGEAPPPFDVLFWNMDTTRMPYAMHSWYLRELYLHNKLIEKDALTVAGEPIDLGAIVQPVYAVSAEDDHIAPWRQTFRTMNYVAGPKRFVLSSSGHILGIVNPPVKPAKRQYWVAPARRSDTADGWRTKAVENAGSWWEDWMAWLKPQAGELVDAAPVLRQSLSCSGGCARNLRPRALRRRVRYGQDLPRFKMMFECKTGIGRACRGHPVKAAPQGRQCRDHEAAEGRFRCRTVEEDPLHARVVRQERWRNRWA